MAWSSSGWDFGVGPKRDGDGVVDVARVRILSDSARAPQIGAIIPVRVVMEVSTME